MAIGNVTVPSFNDLVERIDRDSPAAVTPVSDSQPAAIPMASLGEMLGYKWRMVITGVLLWGTWGGLLSSPLIVQPGSLTAILADYFGWLMFFTGLTVRVWGTRYIGGRKLMEVVCSGPYSLCRNPLYVGTFLMILSLACFLKSVTFCAASFLVIAYYAVAVVPLEEHLLRQLMGAAYVNYCASVPRWLPRWGQVYAPSISLNSQAMKMELRRAAWWLLLPLVAAANLYCRGLPWWPFFLNLP